VDTQFELTRHKDKPGTATAVDATSWKPRMKVALPQIDLNNPHNMWADRNQDLIYQTMWFDHFLATFDRKTGQLVNNLMVGPDPSHAMTLTNNDHVHIALDGSDDANAVVEIAPGGGSILRTVKVTRKILNRLDVAVDGSLSVITTLEFFQHHSAKVGHS
jgi:hypothetical protein